MTDPNELDRDPEESPPPVPIVTYLAITISVVLFVLKDWTYVATAWDIYDGSFWSLVTSAFYHVGLLHIAFNVYWLWVLGRSLERVVGSGRFLLFFVAAAWVSSAAELVVSDQTGVGLSGVGYALFGAMWFAQAQVPAFRRVIDEQVIGLFVLWLFLALGLTIVGGANYANAAHFGGLLFGALIGTGARPERRKVAITGAVLLLVTSTATLFFAPWSSTWQGLQGQRAQEAGDLDRALGAFTRSIELDPEDPWGYETRGWVFNELEDWDRAIADFSEAIDRNPRYLWAYGGRGRARRKQGEFDLAVLDLNRAIEINDKYAFAYTERGWVRIEQEEYERAIEDFSTALRLDPESRFSLQGRGRARQRLNEVDGSLDDLTRAIEIDPADDWSYDERGWVRIDRKEYDLAIEDFTRAIELDPSTKRAYAGRGQARWLLDDLEGAIADLDRAIEIDGDYAWAYDERGWVRIDREEYDLAIEDFTRAIELDPSTKRAYAGRGQARRLSDDLEGAIGDLDKAIEIDGEYAWAYDERGWVRSAQDDFDQAMEDFTRAIELDPDSTSSFIGRGQVRSSSGDLEGALADFTKAIELDAASSWSYAQRGWVHAELNNHIAAIKDFTIAIEADPNNAWAYMGRGWSRSSTGEGEGAIADFREAVRLAPADLDIRKQLAQHLFESGDHTGFLKAMAPALELGLDDPECLHRLAWVRITATDPVLRDYDQALALAKQLVEQRPDSGEYQGTLGIALYRNGRWAEARDALRQCIYLDNQTIRILFFLAMAEHRSGHPREARRVFDKATGFLDLIQPNDAKLRRLQAEAFSVLDAG